jgi:hypothetical protein
MQSESLARDEPRTLVAVHLNTEVSGHCWPTLKRWEHLERLELTFLKHFERSKAVERLERFEPARVPVQSSQLRPA